MIIAGLGERTLESKADERVKATAVAQGVSELLQFRGGVLGLRNRIIGRSQSVLLGMLSVGQASCLTHLPMLVLNMRMPVDTPEDDHMDHMTHHMTAAAAHQRRNVSSSACLLLAKAVLRVRYAHACQVSGVYLPAI